MLAVYACALVIVLASLVVGRALFAAFGREDWTWLEGAVGLAVLTIVAQVTIRLPGRAVTTLVVFLVLLVASLVYLWRWWGLAVDRDLLLKGLAVALVVMLAAAIPFALTGHVGVLGEGVYSNDHAVHLYWADWLQNGVGAEPRGLGLGYPVGPHAVVAAVSSGSGASIEDAFNGFLIAIPALTALTALAALDSLPPLRRFAGAALVGLPYLGAAFLAQSSFKETAVALYVLAFTLALAGLTRPGGLRALLAALPLLALAAVMTLSVPALLWFVLAGGTWLLVALATRKIPASVQGLAARLRRAWPVFAGIAVVLGVLVLLQYDALTRFIDRVDDVQASTGRLLEREPPWQVLGVWPQGDFRVSTGAVTGAYFAIGFALLAALAAVPSWVRRREVAVPAALLAAVVIYGYTLAFGGIHVQAKALAVAAPLVLLFIVGGLLDPGRRPGSEPDQEPAGRSPWAIARLALGALFVVFAAGSSFLALRQAPVGTNERARQLEALRDQVAGADVVFLGLDRFAPYRLRGAESVQSPGGYVPESVHARRGKAWVQGEQLDFDSLPSGRYDRYRYAITTTTPYASSAPANFSEVDRTADFILWERSGDAPSRDTLRNEGGSPGTPLHCARRDSELEGVDGTAGVIAKPLVRPFDAWQPSASLIAPGDAEIRLDLPAGRWRLALQYNSEVSLQLTVVAPGGAGEKTVALDEELPVALEGMYAFAPGRGPFWSLGEIESKGGRVEVRLHANEPTWLERLTQAQRRVWLGRLAFVPVSDAPMGLAGPPTANQIPLDDACDKYIDWYELVS